MIKFLRTLKNRFFKKQPKGYVVLDSGQRRTSLTKVERLAAKESIRAAIKHNNKYYNKER